MLKDLSPTKMPHTTGICSLSAQTGKTHQWHGNSEIRAAVTFGFSPRGVGQARGIFCAVGNMLLLQGFGYMIFSLCENPLSCILRICVLFFVLGFSKEVCKQQTKKTNDLIHHAKCTDSQALTLPRRTAGRERAVLCNRPLRAGGKKRIWPGLGEAHVI